MSEGAGSLRRALLAAGAAFLLLALAIHLLGAAGYRGGFLVAAIPLAVVPGVVVWALAGADNNRWTWASVAVVLAVTAAGWLTSSAPPSRARLDERVDALVPPFFERARTVSTGHSWCRPSCPVVTLELRPPDTGVRAIMLDLGAEFLDEGLVEERELERISLSTSFEAKTEHIEYSVELRGERPERVVTVTARAMR